MVNDTYVISKSNTSRDIENIKERFQWISNHANDQNILTKIEFSFDDTTEPIKINSTPNIEKKICSIGILSTYDRVHYLLRLLTRIREVITPEMAKQFHIIVNMSFKNISVGAKRNAIVNYSNSEYLCFVDDDDMISENYFSLLSKAFQEKPDAVGLLGVIYYINDKENKLNRTVPFIHCNQIAAPFLSGDKTGEFVDCALHKNIKDINPKLQNTWAHCSIITHLCPIRTNIIKEFIFDDKFFNEDLPWARKIYDSGLIKKEVLVSDFVYHYMHREFKVDESWRTVNA